MTYANGKPPSEGEKSKLFGLFCILAPVYSKENGVATRKARAVLVRSVRAVSTVNEEGGHSHAISL